MKKYFVFLIAAFVILPLMCIAQSKSDKMYDVFSDRDGITNFSFSKNMIDAIDLDIGGEENGEKKVTGDLNKIKFMSYNPKKGNLTGPDFIEKVIGFLPKSSYHKYKDPDGCDDDAEIWLMGKKKKYSECHVFFKNDNTGSLHFVVSFYGDFKVSDMGGIKELGRGFSE